MKFCAATVLCLITATSADVGQKNGRNLGGPRCPPPNRPPPPPLSNGGSWIWVCKPSNSKPSWGGHGSRWEDDGYSADDSDDGDWEDDGYSVGESDDGKWGDDVHVVEETDDWNGDANVVVESDDSVDDGEWSDDGHAVEETEVAAGDDASEDGHVEKVVEEDWEGDGYVGEESVDTWDDDGYGDREPVIEGDHKPAIGFIEEEAVDNSTIETKSVPAGAIAGAAVAALVAAIIALMVAHRHKADRFIDGEEKESIGTDEDVFVPTSEQKISTEGDIEIDHTFFDENLFQENYQEQEMAYEDDDLSTINEDDLDFTGDERSV